MRRLVLAFLVLAFLVLALAAPAAAQEAEKRRGFSIHVIAPTADEFVLGRTKIHAEVQS